MSHNLIRNYQGAFVTDRPHFSSFNLHMTTGCRTQNVTSSSRQLWKAVWRCFIHTRWALRSTTLCNGLLSHTLELCWLSKDEWIDVCL